MPALRIAAGELHHIAQDPVPHAPDRPIESERTQQPERQDAGRDAP
jgi:hypothetical protein